MKISQCEHLTDELFNMTEEFVISADLIISFKSDFSTHLIGHHGGEHKKTFSELDIQDLKGLRSAITKILNKTIEIE